MTSTDQMGYGWNRANMIVPALSECDLKGIAHVFERALLGVCPYRPTLPYVTCD